MIPLTATISIMVKSITTSKTQLASTARSHEIAGSKHASLERHDSGNTDAPDPSAFLSAALGMSWQLAVVVILPIVGGYKLDEQLGSAPWLTIAGFVLAMAASVLVIRRALSEMNKISAPKDTTTKDADV